MIINSSIISGENFELVEEGHILIEKDKISEIKDGFVSDGLDFRSYVIMPALINAHTHVGDSFAKEAVLGLTAEEAVGPRGKKWELYDRVKDEKILRAMKDSIEYMLNSGISVFVDFREGGAKGVNLIKEAIDSLEIKPIILGRNLDISLCDGLGLNVYELEKLPSERKGKIIAIHAGELEGEVEEALKYSPNIIIHCTKTSNEEIEQISKRKISVVICPRSNASLGAGFPPVKELLNSGINLAIGTDNVMVNSPNLWREMEFLSKVSYLQKEPLKPREILRMVTLNAAKMLNLNSGAIKKGKDADLIFLDKDAKNLRYSKNLLATIVNRCEAENVRKVMIDGKIVIDKDVR